jgi:hypothetical protein
VQQAAKKLAASPSGEAVVATYLGGEDERSPEQIEAGEQSTVDEHGGRPIMGVLFPEGEEVPVTGDVLLRKLRSLAAVGIFELRPWQKGDGEPKVQKLFVAPKRDMAALKKKALAQEAKRRGSVV